MLLIAGLIALCVEFSRVTATDCSHDEAGVPILTVAKFPYGETTCGLTCSEDDGPFSPMRGGAAKNIYVIPVPSKLSFNAAMLIAAGVCIPAILSLIFTWDKILEINWKNRREPERLDEQLEGVNITRGEIKGINNKVRLFLSVIEMPLFGGAVVAILIAGELNFFSKQLMYQTEPMASIGTSSHSLCFTLLILTRAMVAYCRYSDGRNRILVHCVGHRWGHHCLWKGEIS